MHLIKRAIFRVWFLWPSRPGCREQPLKQVAGDPPVFERPNLIRKANSRHLGRFVHVSDRFVTVYDVRICLLFVTGPRPLGANLPALFGSSIHTGNLQ